MQIFDQTVTILFVKNFPRGCTEFPEFSTFVEIPEYSRFSRFVATPTCHNDRTANTVISIIIIIERRDFGGTMSNDCKDTLQTQNKTVRV